MIIERIDAQDVDPHHVQDVDARKAIYDRLEAFNDAASGRPEPERRFAAVVRDGDGHIAGGAAAVFYWDWAFVELLHLPESMRGAGVGTRVMRAIESEARRRGGRGVWLDTISFQAPGFYRKQGYTEFARIPEFIPGSTRYWFGKTELAAGPNAGLDERIAILDPPTPDELAIISTGLRAYNESRSGVATPLPVGLVVRAAPGAPVEGGLWGRIQRGWLFVEMLVVPEAARGQGLGRRLMAAAERVAREMEGRGVWLDTFSFQARPFYEKLGYAVIGEIPDYPAPHRRFLLAKRLDGAQFVPVQAGALTVGTA